ncbi:MAG: DinB family protein [Chloroflexi bacterium]|nr:DinB family protein [Chloroflexota bacterium]
MATDEATREHLLIMLRSNAGRRLEAATKDFPMEAINTYPPNVDYTPWQLLEHLRISLLDIVEYARDAASYQLRRHPDDYWPRQDAVASPAQWQQTLDQYGVLLAELESLVADPNLDLTAPLPNTPGHSVFREAGLVIGHMAYHIGEFGILRQVMQTWPPDHGRSARG